MRFLKWSVTGSQNVNLRCFHPRVAQPGAFAQTPDPTSAAARFLELEQELAQRRGELTEAVERATMAEARLEEARAARGAAEADGGSERAMLQAASAVATAEAELAQVRADVETAQQLHDSTEARYRIARERTQLAAEIESEPAEESPAEPILGALELESRLERREAEVELARQL